MNISQFHAEISNTFRGLPGPKTLASYNYIDQLVLFDSVELREIVAAGQATSLAERWQIHFKLWVCAFHEYRHWLDMTSSVFGLSWLGELFDVLEAHTGKQQVQPEQVDKCQHLSRRMAGIHLPDYYSTIDNAIGPPWKCQPTVGFAFIATGESNPNHPLWFVRFTTPEGVPISRQPISLSSLLEVRAVASEMVAGYGLLHNFPDKDFRAIEQNHFTQSILGRLYDPELTVYSAAAHWYANHRGITDAGEAYRASALLAWFCLDAPTVWIEGLTTSSEFKKVQGEQMAARMNISLQRRDRGALFFMLASDSRIKGADRFWEQLDAVLQLEWGITLAVVQQNSRVEARQLLDRLATTPGPVKALVDIWRHNQDIQRAGRPLDVADINIKLPAVILADDTPLDVFRMRWDSEAFDNRIFDPRPYLDEFMKPYLDLCRHGAYSDRGKHCFSVA